jgi:hypothetical protein
MPGRLPWSDAAVNLPGSIRAQLRVDRTGLAPLDQGELAGVGHSIGSIDPAFARGRGQPEAGSLLSAHALKYPQMQQHRCRGLPARQR